MKQEDGGLPTEEGGGRVEDELDRLIRRRSGSGAAGSEDDDEQAMNEPDAGEKAGAGPEPSMGYAGASGEAGGATFRASEAPRPTAPPERGFIVRRTAVRPLERRSVDGAGLWVSRSAAVLGGLAVLAAIVVIWRLLADIVAGGSIRLLVEQLLSMKDPFQPLPAPEDPVVSANLSLRSAARVGAPLVVAVFWFAGGFQIDRAARKAFEARRAVGSGLPIAYSAVAIGCVFPLLVGGVIGLAWGGISLAIWSIRNQAWLATAQLLGLLLAFGLAARLIDALQDGREGQGRRIRR